MTRVFIDTDILLDLISGRSPFGKEAASLFVLIDQKLISACASSIAAAAMSEADSAISADSSLTADTVVSIISFAASVVV